MKNRDNYARAEIIAGKYKGKNLDIVIGKTGAESEIRINGRKVENCTGAYIRMVPNEITKVYLTFVS